MAVLMGNGRVEARPHATPGPHQAAVAPAPVAVGPPAHAARSRSHAPTGGARAASAGGVRQEWLTGDSFLDSGVTRYGPPWISLGDPLPVTH